MAALHKLIGIRIRIITYFNSDIKKIQEIIEGEFDIDQSKSGDKFSLLGDNQFGYRSVHYIAKINPMRLKLPEYYIYSDLSFEIQIRSILQHAWAEIEHDIGYKSDSPKSDIHRRSFSQIASFLEVADEKFDDIRRDFKNASESLYNQIKSRSDTVEISSKTVEIFSDSDLVNKADIKITQKSNLALIKVNQISSSQASNNADAMKVLGFKSLSEFQAFFSDNFDNIVEFAARYFNSPQGKYDEVSEQETTSVSSGISVFYALYYRIAQNPQSYDIERYSYAQNFHEELDSKFIEDLTKIYNDLQ